MNGNTPITISLILFLYKNGDLGISLCLHAQPVLRSKDPFLEGVSFLFIFLYNIVVLCLEIAKLQKLDFGNLGILKPSFGNV